MRARLPRATPALLAACQEWVRRVLPPPVETRGPRAVPTTFWSCGRRGANALTRLMEVPTWEGIAPNSPAGVRGPGGGADGRRRAGEDAVASSSGTGRWHRQDLGDPRAGAEWRERCSPHYVVDPEVFLREPTGYRLRVLLSREDDEGRTAGACWCRGHG